MKKDKEWLKRQVEQMNVGWEESHPEYHRACGEALKLINQLDEPELPVIPQFVADYLKVHKKAATTLYGSMDSEFLNTQELTRWMTEGRNQLKFARAWLEDYTIEKEKQYFVKEPITGQFLVKDIKQSNGVKWVDGFSSDPERYSEKEIKAIDMRYWTFAEEETQ